MQQEEEESSPNGRVHVSTATVFLRQSQTLPISLATPPQQAPPPTPPIDSIELQGVHSSEMSARIETSTSVKQWATPLEKHVTGQPPGPEDRPSTIEGEARRGNVRTITPSYKYGSEKPGAEINLGQSGSLPRAYGDYTVEQRQDMYKQTFIDPKVRSNANMPALSSTVPEPRRPRADDFPSQHTKRSFVKVDPLEQRKLKSVETIPITTSSYLTQSIERHRDMEASKLRDYLKAKEGDANKPWDKPGWPGPKPPANDESLRELESIKKSIETLQKAAQEPKKNDELDELGRKSDQLAERSRQMRAGYKLQGREIIKEKPEPLPQSLKDQLRDLQASRTSLHTEATNKDGYVTDVSSATWQFSGQSFSPRSVISVNGAKEEGLLKVRTSVDHLRQDDKPRSIMKRRELENREQMLYPAHQEKSYTRTVSNVHKPVKTETVQRFEETRRTEEIERRVQRKERKDRRSRHHSSSRREEWGHGGGGEYDSDDELRVRREIEIREKRERDIREHELRERERRMSEIRERELRQHEIRERELRERELREREIRERELRERELREREIRERELREREFRERSHREQDAAVQVDLVEVKRPRVIYTRRAMTAAELAKYISDAHRVANQANKNMSQWRSSSLSRHQNGYLPSNESYFKQTTTRRDRDQSANRGAWEEERNLANARYGSLSDSLRRGELKYIPNGEVREAYYKDGRGGQKVHKSYSTRDVFDSGMDRHSAASYGAGGRRSSQGQGVQPLVEFPPTLPRRGQHEMDFRPVSKSRSFADWDDQSRAGFKGGHQDWAMQRRYDDDMTRLEAEFRDSLLMPIPNGNMHERDQRTEQLPGGYETYYKDNRANAGRRLNRDGQPVDFSDASHEYSYKREQETSDRRR